MTAPEPGTYHQAGNGAELAANGLALALVDQHVPNGAQAQSPRNDERMKPEQALALTRAQLSRDPRDGLEAAVVLEAWGGLPPNEALELGTALMRLLPSHNTEPPAPARVKPPEPMRWVAEILGLVGFVSMATWGVPLGNAHPNVNVDVAFRIGVPLALALQWMLQRRYFSGDAKLGSFGSDGTRLLAVMLVAVVALAATGPTGVLIATLEVIWFSGYVLAKDGVGVIYVLALGATTWDLYRNVEPTSVLPLVAFGLATFAILRVARHNQIRSRKVARSTPVAWIEVIPSVIIGMSLGIMMVSSITTLRPHGWTLAAALIPAGGGGLVAAAILRSLWFDLDTELSSVQGRWVQYAGADNMRRRLNLAAIGYFVTCFVLSLFVAPFLMEKGQSFTATIQLLTGFALLSRLTMVANLQQSWNRIGLALMIAVPACIVNLAMRFTDTNAPASLVVGSSVGLIIALVAQRVMAQRPAEAIATGISIP